MSRASARILLVEDEVNLALGIAENLEAEGHAVEHVVTGEAALEALRARPFDLVVLDVMLPGVDGFTVCESARAAGVTAPVLFLTARGSGDDRIRGLEVGGDDYLSKPFALRELLLRVGAILRRSRWYRATPPSGTLLRFGDNEVDLASFHARAFDGREHVLGEKEAMLLKALAESPGAVVTREEVLDKVWGYEVLPATRVIDGLLDRLRRRFEADPRQPRHLHTVAGLGYRLDPHGP